MVIKTVQKRRSPKEIAKDKAFNEKMAEARAIWKKWDKTIRTTLAGEELIKYNEAWERHRNDIDTDYDELEESDQHSIWLIFERALADRDENDIAHQLLMLWLEYMGWPAVEKLLKKAYGSKNYKLNFFKTLTRRRRLTGTTCSL